MGIFDVLKGVFKTPEEKAQEKKAQEKKAQENAQAEKTKRISAEQAELLKIIKNQRKNSYKEAMRKISHSIYSKDMRNAVYEALKEKDFAVTAYPFIVEYYEQIGLSNEGDICAEMIDTVIKHHPQMADKFCGMLDNYTGYYQHNVVDYHIARGILENRPDLTERLMETDVGRLTVAQSGDYKTYMNYILRVPSSLEDTMSREEFVNRLRGHDHEAENEYYAQGRDKAKHGLYILYGLDKYPELLDKSKVALSYISHNGREILGGNLSFSAENNPKDVPTSTFALIKDDKNYFETEGCENKSLKILTGLTKKRPEMAGEINQFIVDTFCKDETSILYCHDGELFYNDAILITGALKETIKSGYVTKDEGKKYLKAIKNSKFQGDNSFYDKWYFEDTWNPRDDEIKALEEHIRDTKATLNENIEDIQTLVTGKQSNQKETEPAQRPQKGKYDKQLNEARKNLKKARESVSGVVMADKIAEDIKAGKEKNVTPDRAKEIADKKKREYALAKKQAFHQ